MILHYFFDPLCGWCYGFTDTIKRFYENHKSELDIEVISGGMVRGEHEKPIEDIAFYIKGAFRRVEEVSQKKFGQPFLDKMEEGSMVISSVPASTALTVFKSEFDSKALDYASDLLHAIYRDGTDPYDMDHFAELAGQYGYEKSLFLKRVEEDEYRKETYDDFSVTQQFKVTGYPTAIVFAQDEYFLLSKGFTSYEDLEKTYNSIKASIAR